MRVYFLCVIVFFILSHVRLGAQVTVTPGIDTGAVHALIVQPGLSISNISINCNPAAYGEFTGRSELPITHGLFLCTGKGVDAFSPNNAANTTTAFGTTDTIHGLLPMNDACSISFDVRSTDSVIAFIFSFGSEEYPEYVNSSFNDVFAILVYGPQPDYAGYYNNLNIAYLPDSSSTCINHVNTQHNMTSFYDNTFPQGRNMEYDGLTNYMRATVRVIPDSTYRITFAIADQDDPFFDSGGFIAAEDSDNHSLPVMPPSGVDCYPNPVTDELEWLPTQGLVIESAVLYNELGQVVYVVEDPSEQRSINMSGYARGVYILKIEGIFFTYTFRVIKT